MWFTFLTFQNNPTFGKEWLLGVCFGVYRYLSVHKSFQKSESKQIQDNEMHFKVTNMLERF